MRRQGGVAKHGQAGRSSILVPRVVFGRADAGDTAECTRARWSQRLGSTAGRVVVWKEIAWTIPAIQDSRRFPAVNPATFSPLVRR